MTVGTQSIIITHTALVSRLIDTNGINGTMRIAGGLNDKQQFGIRHIRFQRTVINVF